MKFYKRAKLKKESIIDDFYQYYDDDNSYYYEMEDYYFFPVNFDYLNRVEVFLYKKRFDGFYSKSKMVYDLIDMESFYSKEKIRNIKIEKLLNNEDNLNTIQNISKIQM